VLTFLSIFCALATGYCLADYHYNGVIRRSISKFSQQQSQTTHYKQTGYYDVLTSLLNEQTDEALDAFVHNMSVTAETLEVHLALASLLRRRGEFARAVRVHENLLKPNGLNADQRNQVLLELATDYWRSGMLDRAESILNNLTRVQGINKAIHWQALAYLVEIYRDLEQWLEAIDVADQLTEKKFSSEPDFWRRLQAQFACEIAEREYNNASNELALSKAKQALVYDPQCLRAKLLLAQLANDEGDRSLALSYIYPVVDSHPEFIPELIQALKPCFHDKNEYIRVLREYVIKHYSIAAMLEISAETSNKAALKTDWLALLAAMKTDQLPELKMIALALENAQAENTADTISRVETYLTKKMSYFCSSCGTEYTHLRWQCISCNAWASIHPNIG